MECRQIVKAFLPRALVGWIQRKRFRTARPPVGWVRLGSLRRTTPISAFWGLDRGTPIDRRYIDAFIVSHRADIRGRVLEVGDNRYTTAHGDGRVTRSDILHAVPGNPQATFTGDLASGAGLPDAAFDCIILTQVLQYIPDQASALRHLYRILAPGGTLLVTLPSLSKGDRGNDGKWSDWWRYTVRSTEALFAETFDGDSVTVRSFGNVLSASASLMGLAQEDLTAKEIDVNDLDYPVVITVRACRSTAKA